MKVFALLPYFHDHDEYNISYAQTYGATPDGVADGRKTDGRSPKKYKDNKKAWLIRYSFTNGKQTLCKIKLLLCSI